MPNHKSLFFEVNPDSQSLSRNQRDPGDSEIYCPPLSKPGSKSSDHGKICILLDGAPPPGDSTGCNPTFNSNSGEMTWEDFHMNIVKGSQNL